MPQWKPLIITANFTPNPVNVGEPTVLSVMVVDAQVGQIPETWYSNEARSGEV